MSPLRTTDAARPAAAYRVDRHPAPVELDLDANEAPAWVAEALLRGAAATPPDALARYPSPAVAEAQLAERLGVPPGRVLLTCGGDDALMRACRAWLGPDRALVLPCPTFEMLERDARACGAPVRRVPWPDGPYPVDEVLAQVDARTGLLAVVSPNNPTGAVATPDDLLRLCAGRGRARVLLDLAYAEFADDDLLRLALDLPGVVVVRTFSKARGLAGLRVGYALGAPEDIAALRTAGLPYPVGGPSWELARRSLDHGGPTVQRLVRRVRQERQDLRDTLRELGLDAPPSQANFVLARTPRARWLRDGLAGLGVGVRLLEQRAGLDAGVRISCPGAAGDTRRVRAALRTALAPQALLFDLDGVLADVSRSYREAIVLTAAGFGVEIDPADVAAAKAAGDANNDWVLTWRLLRARGVDASLHDVTERFERLYQGDGAHPGLKRRERPLASRELLERLGARLPLGLVTGRPRRDALEFLARFDLRACFDALVCLEDAPAKPDPAPVRRALDALGVAHAWMVGDTPDDVRAARAAGVLPLGVVAPGDAARLTAGSLSAAGAARVLEHLDDLTELLP